MSERREAEVDYVIIGTGAGGATAARVLAEAGRSLLLLEEGPELRTAERSRAVRDAMRTSFRDGGTMSTQSRTPLPVLQGRLVGGSTAINSGIIWRMPDDVRELWTREHGLGELVEARALEATFERIEQELSIAETAAEVRGRNAELMASGAAALGLEGRPIARNARDCVGSARCLQGCPRGARQSMDVSYVPFATSRGAELWPLARAEQIELERGRAHGVRGRLLDSDGKPRGRFRVRARRGVIVAAGALHTPLLLWRTGLRGLVGERFQAHPGAAVAGRFPEPVYQSFGATQAYEVPLRSRGFKLEALSLPPELLAARLPGVGGEFQQRLGELPYWGHWVTQVRMRALGRVRPGLFSGGPVLHYQPTTEDLARVRESVALLVRMFFAAGAIEVSHGLHGLPPIFTHADQARQIEQQELRLEHVHLLASHLFGTACAGADPARSVVAPNLESHAIPQLFVMDASVFPTNMGVNPQHSIMALAYRAAERLA
jgi:choline dehydrogenase-like flavoprotein